MLTTQEKIQEIKKACIATNPAILDLVFGCEVYADVEIPMKITYVFPEGPNSERCVRLDDNSQWAIVDLEIIGRQLQLSDLLYAIQKLKKPVTDDWYNFTKNYNLLKPFEEQEPPIVDFLYQLLIQGK